jgi:hypothetical protein
MPALPPPANCRDQAQPTIAGGVDFDNSVTAGRDRQSAEAATA